MTDQCSPEYYVNGLKSLSGLRTLTPDQSDFLFDAAAEIEQLRDQLATSQGLCTQFENAVADDLGELLSLRAEITRLRAASEWRDISTAPRDGQLAIVYRPLAHMSGDQPVAVKRLVEGNHYCWDTTVPPGEKPNNPTADGSCHVTHWQPLPAPPQRNEVKK